MNKTRLEKLGTNATFKTTVSSAVAKITCSLEVSLIQHYKTSQI